MVELSITEVEIAEDMNEAGSFLVEAIDDDGGVHIAKFVGSHAEQQARQWSAHAYGYNGPLMSAPTRRFTHRPRPNLTIVPPDQTP